MTAPGRLLAGALLLCSATPQAVAAPADVVVVAPREARWSDVVPRSFDLARTLPEDTETGFVEALAALTELRWENGPTGKGDARLHTLGDLVREIDRRGGSNRAVDNVLADLARREPVIWARYGEQLSELLHADRFDEDWSPDDDDERDGLLIGAARSLESLRRAPWKDLSGTLVVQQGASVIRADLDAIKAVENDYRGYPGHVGASFEAIGPLAGSYVRGDDALGRPFAALQIVFECDLPFPFSTYRCHLRILNRVDDRDRLVTDVYSTSADFHWLAGRDTFLPIRADDGTLVAHLMVRQYGFDLDGVPEGDGARRTSVRSGIGNLKRRAEEQQRGALVERSGTIPAFSVTGSRGQ